LQVEIEGTTTEPGTTLRAPTMEAGWCQHAKTPAMEILSYNCGKRNMMVARERYDCIIMKLSAPVFIELSF